MSRPASNDGARDTLAPPRDSYTSRGLIDNVNVSAR
jgi:hypothetical protein